MEVAVQGVHIFVEGIIVEAGYQDQISAVGVELARVADLRVDLERGPRRWQSGPGSATFDRNIGREILKVAVGLASHHDDQWELDHFHAIDYLDLVFIYSVL